MTDSHEAPRRSPWLSVWLAPRETIARIVADDPRRHVVLLVLLGGIATVFARVAVDRPDWLLSDWRLIALFVVGGAVLGVVNLYIIAMLFTWGGRLVGGGASQAETRAAIAWSSLPHLAILPILPVALVIWRLDDEDARLVLLGVVGLVALLFSLWSLILLVAMLSRVNRVGIGRGLLGFAIGGAMAWLLIPLLIRTLVLQPYNIPSGGQLPTLLIGDYMFVTKYSYGYSRYALPFSPPLFAGRIMGAEPQRGDVVVFRLPRDDSTDYIKRVIGLPGDRIQVIKGHLHINGTPVQREQIGDFVDHDAGPDARPVRRWRETLPNRKSYEILDLQDNGFYDNTQVYEVPAGHYFMMGDNRDNSTDSRALAQLGYVPFDKLIGRAAFIYFSVAQPEKGQARLRLGRLGRRVD